MVRLSILLVQHHHRLEHVRRQRAVTRKPGELFTGSGSRSMGADEGERLLLHLRVGCRRG